MTRRFRPTDAFVDESVRGTRYLLGCVLVEARHLTELRSVMVDLAVYQRVHFNNESDHQRRRVLTAIATMPIAASVFVCHRAHGVSERAARHGCLSGVIQALQSREVLRLVIESRGDDSRDERHLLRVRQPSPRLVFEHRGGSAEPMLWIADAVAWACGAGLPWRPLIDGIVESVIDVRP